MAAIGRWFAQKMHCELEHGQPAQRTMSKVIFDGFLWVFDPSWSQSSQNGVPIVQLRAPRTGTSSAQLGPHFGSLSVKLERTGSSKPKKIIPGNKNITFSCTSLNQEYWQGWGGLGFHLIAGWARGSGQAGTCRQALNSYCLYCHYYSNSCVYYYYYVY